MSSSGVWETILVTMHECSERAGEYVAGDEVQATITLKHRLGNHSGLR